MSIINEALKKAEEKAKIFDRFKNGFKIKDHPEKSENDRSNRMRLVFIISGGLVLAFILFFVSNRVISHRDIGDEGKSSIETKHDVFKSKKVSAEKKGTTTLKEMVAPSPFAKKRSIESHTRKKTLKSPPIEQRVITPTKKEGAKFLTQEKGTTPPRSKVQHKGFNADHHLKVGNIYYKKGLYDKAINEYKRGINISPRHAKLHNNLGNSYFNKGFIDLAFNEYKEAIRIDPLYDISHYNLGCLYSKKADNEKAIFHLKKAISLNKECKEWAKDDTDFNNIRHDKAFKELIYGSSPKKLPKVK